VRSRPDRQPDGVERRARDSYIATPPFTLVTDEYVAAHVSDPLHLRVKPSPRVTAVNKYWFNPSWIAENERPEVDHGEFQSPVWLAVEMTMRSDRDRDRACEAHEADTPRHARHAAEESGTGQLRSMLAFVSGAKQAGSNVTPITKIHPEVMGDKVSASSRYHDLPQRPARPVRNFARFISNNFGKSASITTERRLATYE
jgi:hypothetical protein